MNDRTKLKSASVGDCAHAQPHLKYIVINKNLSEIPVELADNLFDPKRKPFALFLREQRQRAVAVAICLAEHGEIGSRLFECPLQLGDLR